MNLRNHVIDLQAAVVDDLESIRKANVNRLDHLIRTGPDADGGVRGLGMTNDHPDVRRLELIIEGLAKIEHDAVLNLQRTMRTHPLYPWIKEQRGIGDKTAARLLAAIGDPYWNDLYDRPRTVSELWQYAGHGDPERSRRRKGQRVQYSPEAKMRLYLISEGCMKQLDRTCPSDPDTGIAKHAAGCGCSVFRIVYDNRKTETLDRVHAAPCVRCGPKGKPAESGSPWSRAHRNADALRIVGKEILRDLWTEARKLHD
jgi:hypothetical protein